MQTDRQRDTWTNRGTNRGTDRQTERNIQTDGQNSGPTHDILWPYVFILVHSMEHRGLERIHSYMPKRRQYNRFTLPPTEDSSVQQPLGDCSRAGPLNITSKMHPKTEP